MDWKNFISVLVTLILQINEFYGKVAPGADNSKNSVFVQDIRMPGVTTSQHDDYLCTAKKIDEREAYIVQYEVHSEDNRAHHILLFGCDDLSEYQKSKRYWECLHNSMCSSPKIMFAWAKNAPPTTLPKDVGFRTGGISGVNYLVLQVHYAHEINVSDSSGIALHTTYQPQKYVAGIFLLLAQMVKIPPLKPKVHADINCPFDSEIPIYPFGFRVHAHSLGTVITGYKYDVKTQKWTLLGKGNPQWPQAFYPMDRIHSVKNTDILAARCTFNSSARNRWTEIGSTADDEMCNFYIMYYTDAELGQSFSECVDVEYPELVDLLPLGSDTPLPQNPLLEEESHKASHHQAGISYDNIFDTASNTTSNESNKIGHIPLNSKPNEPSIEDSSSVEQHFDSNGGREGERIFSYLHNPGHQVSDHTSDSLSLYKNRIKNHHTTPLHKTLPSDEQLTSAHNKESPDILGEPQGKGLLSRLWPSPPPPPPPLNMFEDVLSWPIPEKELGQVSAVALDSSGNVIIFHRGKRMWDSSSFDLKNHFRQVALGPIQDNTVVVFDSGMGNIVHQWGSNYFYMPHGLTVDSFDNIWVTDVALHQIMKFPPGGAAQPSMVLGERFAPGKDDNHFCKPSSVAVASNGDFYVADGYCNNRIMKFSSTGRLILQWGKPSYSFLKLVPKTITPYAFDIPHKVILAEDKGLVCVADRENGRIQCFTMTNGTFHCQIHPPQFGNRLFSVAYSPSQGGLLFAVNGPISYSNNNNVQGFVINITSQSLIGGIRPVHGQTLSNPHDIAVSMDGAVVYIAEIGPNKIWKFVSSHRPSKKVLNAETATVKQDTHKSTINPSSEEKQSTSKANTFLESSKHVAEENKAVQQDMPVKVAEDLSSFGTSMIIMALLAIPILLMIFVTVFIRLRKQGKFHGCSTGHMKGWMSGYKQPNSDHFSIGNFLNHHKGFDPVCVEESDGELDGSDSDVEEFSAGVQKA